MNRKKILSVFMITIMFLLLVIPNNSIAASNLNLKTLDFDITLNADGSMDMVETWQISIKDTNTLFKTFGKSDMSGKSISNVKVVEVKNGQEIPFTKTDSYMYHVTEGYYYALTTSNNEFEIAWGVNLRNTTRTYKIYYTVSNAVTTYQDCSELYYKILGSNFEIPADKVTGTIKFPGKVSQKENLRAWAHGPLNGNIQIVSEDTVTFDVDYLMANQMLEVRTLSLENDMFSNNTNRKNVDKLSSIISEETSWAEESNKEREEYIKELENQKNMEKMIGIAVTVILIGVGVLCVFKLLKYYQILQQTPKIEPTTKLDYFRELPDQEATPSDAAFLYYFKNSTMDANLPKVVSAILLDLCLRKCLTFEVTDGNKKDGVKITLTGKEIQESLPEDEHKIYNLLEKVADKETQSFTLKDFEKYAQNHGNVFIKTVNSLSDIAKKSQIAKQNYDTNLISEYKNWSGKGGMYLCFAVFAIFFGISINFWLIALGLIFGANFLLCRAISSRYHTLTQKGTDEKERWGGLKKYMEDFSLLNEREVPELVLWEKYLVFATTFGIADKVIKQLKVRYPELMDETYMATNGYMYSYLMYHNMINTAFITTMNNSVARSYHNSTVSTQAVSNGYSFSNFSSGGGFGGGFSGGGGGGFGGGGGGGR